MDVATAIYKDHFKDNAIDNIFAKVWRRQLTNFTSSTFHAIYLSWLPTVL